MSIHASRVAVFAAMSLLALMSVVTSQLPKGLPLLGCLLLLGAWELLGSVRLRWRG